MSTDAKRSHNEGAGPLSASSGVGGNSIEAPGKPVWYGTFGTFVLCKRDASDQIKIRKVRFKEPVEPLRTKVLLRSVTPAMVASAAPERRALYAPAFSMLGQPPKFSEPYAKVRIPGAYSAKIAGFPVKRTCAQENVSTHAVETGRVPDLGFTEMMFVLKVDRRGGEISDVYVDYTVNGAPRTLHMRWVMIACGSAIEQSGACSA